jgi:hypothetical protein
VGAILGGLAVGALVAEKDSEQGQMHRRRCPRAAAQTQISPIQSHPSSEVFLARPYWKTIHRRRMRNIQTRPERSYDISLPLRATRSASMRTHPHTVIFHPVGHLSLVHSPHSQPRRPPFFVLTYASLIRDSISKGDECWPCLDSPGKTRCWYMLMLWQAGWRNDSMLCHRVSINKV